MMHKVLIAGAGGIGRAVALLLQEGHLQSEVYIGDILLQAAEEATAWVEAAFDHPVRVTPFEMPRTGTNADFDRYLEAADLIMDCLPGGEAPRMARLALKHDLHYANITEYVQETQDIVEMSREAQRGFILQTGLAPGFINILGMQLFHQFCKTHNTERVDSIKMRVGALTEAIESPHYYGFTWSKIGVATEYLMPALVLREGETAFVPSLEEIEPLEVEGQMFEEGLTSGGVSDLPEALAGRVSNMDYKTLRHPGHYRWIKEAIESHRIQSPDELQDFMEREIPEFEKDFVVIYASVTGQDAQGQEQFMKKTYRVRPTQVGKHLLRAIQITTAAGMAESARMLLENKVQGPALQSQIDTEDFMSGPFVSRYFVTR